MKFTFPSLLNSTVVSSAKAKNRGVGRALVEAAVCACADRAREEGEGEEEACAGGKSSFVVQCMALSLYTVKICRRLGFTPLFKSVKDTSFLFK